MKAAFSVEAIGAFGGDRRLNARDPRSRVPWCAEIVGRRGDGFLLREFVDAGRDFTHANGTGTRGVYYWWTLEHGRVYEVAYWMSWSRQVRKFVTVTDDGTGTRDLTSEEVGMWLDAMAEDDDR